MAKLLYNLTGVEVSNVEINTGTKVYPKNYMVFVENEAVIFLSDGVTQVKSLTAKAGTKPADKSTLVAAIAAAKLLVEEDYTPASWAAFQTAITTAEGVLNASGKDATAISTAVAALSTTAVAALRNIKALKASIAIAQALVDANEKPIAAAVLDGELDTAKIQLTGTNQTTINSAVSTLDLAIIAYNEAEAEGED